MKSIKFNSDSNKKEKIIKFFFPFYPLKILKIPYFFCLISALIALRIVLQFFSVPIPQFNTSFSLAHTPIIIAGWLFGPIFGLVFGAFTDTIMFLIKPPLAWFWLYAIQEPLLCSLSGIIGSIFILRLKAKNNIIDLIFLKIIAVIFFIGTYVLTIFYVSPERPMEGGSGFDKLFFTTYKWIALACLLFFFIIFEAFFWTYRKKRKSSTNMVVYLATLSFLNAIIFSFLLGTISTIEFYKFLNNGQDSPFLIKYGAIFYVLPRVIKESIKTPMQIIVLIGVIYAINPLLKKSLNNVKEIYKCNSYIEKNKVLSDEEKHKLIFHFYFKEIKKIMKKK